MTTIADREQEVIEEFGIFGDDWEAKYEHIIELGKALSSFDTKYKTEDALIRGCQSRVWLHSELVDGKMIFSADSDAIITKGLVALMIRVLSGQKPEDIIDTKVDFVGKIGLVEHLSPTRANGLLSMIHRMKEDARKAINRGVNQQ